MSTLRSSCCDWGDWVVSDVDSPNPPPIPTIPCSNCSGGVMAECWELTVAGVTDNNCPQCSLWNGTFLINTPVPAVSCALHTAPFSGALGRTSGSPNCSISGTQCRYQLNFTGTLIRLSIVLPASWPTWNAGWQLTYANGADCTKPNILNERFGNTHFLYTCNWPTEVTIIPILCP